MEGIEVGNVGVGEEAAEEDGDMFIRSVAKLDEYVGFPRVL